MVHYQVLVFQFYYRCLLPGPCVDSIAVIQLLWELGEWEPNFGK